jgi:phosphoglycerol transferase MdoB-like AlkP superfamily enzyme
MNDTYLIPANANRGKLIFGYFRPVDLAVFAIGVVCSLILLFIFQNEMSNTWIAVATLIPAGIAILLVLPIPNQHNVLVLLQAIYNFYFVNRQKYVWRGWCGQYGDENNRKK